MIILKKASDWNKPNWVEAYSTDNEEEKAKVVGIIRPTKEGIKIQILSCNGNPKGLEERITIDRSESLPQIRVNFLPGKN